MQTRRAGFTLIEVLLAIVLIDVGLLALVAGSAVLMRQATEVRARSNALRMANNRIQSLSAGPCASSIGSSVTGDAREQWTVAVQPNRVREVRDSVAFTAAGVERSVALLTRLPC
jgi:Tfp pilus assembly protein PilV